MFQRALAIGGAIIVVILVAVGASGQWLFADAADDELRPADAVVVLGGEHDGREQYGIQLARQIGASTVLLSNPYPSNDVVMAKFCRPQPAKIEVVCRAPIPATTRGEAVMTREFIRERGWQRIVVVTWRFHLLRARLIFAQCDSGQPGQIIMRAVPRSYNFPFALSEFIYFYQYAGLIKAGIRGCDT